MNDTVGVHPAALAHKPIIAHGSGEAGPVATVAPRQHQGDVQDRRFLTPIRWSPICAKTTRQSGRMKRISARNEEQGGELNQMTGSRPSRKENLVEHQRRLRRAAKEIIQNHSKWRCQ